MATVLFTVGDLFERGAELTVLPTSAQGHISRTAEAKVKAFKLPRPKEIPLGTIDVYPFPGAGTHARWIAWAASVMNFTSDPDVIYRLGREIGRLANERAEIQVIESPLLGTGAGGLDPVTAGQSLKSGFEQECNTDAVLIVYGQISTIMARLRKRTDPRMLFDTMSTENHSGAIEIFFSYAHADEALMDDVRRQLIVYERNGRILKWHDRKIQAGANWKAEIDERLNRARIILLFMSPHFIESRYCYEIEGQVALRRHESGEATVVPVVLRPCAWQATPFGKLQALPTDAIPVSRWDDRDEACLTVAQGVIDVVDSLIVS